MKNGRLGPLTRWKTTPSLAGSSNLRAITVTRWPSRRSPLTSSDSWRSIPRTESMSCATIVTSHGGAADVDTRGAPLADRNFTFGSEDLLEIVKEALAHGRVGEFAHEALLPRDSHLPAPSGGDQ